jgi:NAD(P) transhydrogenase subunit beta
MLQFIALIYLVASVLFIYSLYSLSSPKTAKNGNYAGIVAMILAITATLMLPHVQNLPLIIAGIAIGGIIGIIITKKIAITALPQLVAGFHSFVGLSAVLIATNAIYNPENFGIITSKGIKFSSLTEVAIGLLIGAITFSGSIVAFLKLNGNFQQMQSNKIIRFFNGSQKFSKIIAIATIALTLLFILTASKFIFILLLILSLIIGFFLVAGVGGADMPVIVSMLNSYSGFATVGVGFTLNNNLLIITGALVGVSGAILSYIMCKAMNRSIIKVLFAGLESESTTTDPIATTNSKQIKQANAEDIASIMANCQKIIIVPGYGMAVAAAQHIVAELANKLEKNGIEVSFAIHPVAGRMPGHMNVLLAEANIDYDKIFELEEINSTFRSADMVFIIGANDITNPAAKSDKNSPIYGMPILEVAEAKTVVFVKRSTSPGYAGVENQLFYNENTLITFGDAKKVTEEIVKNLN